MNPAQLRLSLDLVKHTWLAQTAPVVPELMRGLAFTADDLHARLPAPAHQNWWGVLLAQLKNAGVIRKAGYRPSGRPQANGRVVAVWLCNFPAPGLPSPASPAGRNFPLTTRS